MTIALTLLSTLLVVGCTSTTPPPPNLTLLSATGERLGLTVEVADEPQEHERGLMGRTEIPKGAGMLFVFATPRPLSFWMKDTVIPLDIFFFDVRGVLMSSATMTPCMKDPCPTYASRGAAKYALEVASGFGARHGVGEGWRMEWTP